MIIKILTEFLILQNIFLNMKAKDLQKSGVKQIRIHDYFRHSHASLLIELVFSPLLISERFRYERVETTLNTYSHLYPNKGDIVSKKLNKLYLYYFSTVCRILSTNLYFKSYSHSIVAGGLLVIS